MAKRAKAAKRARPAPIASAERCDGERRPLWLVTFRDGSTAIREGASPEEAANADPGRRWVSCVKYEGE